MADRDIETIVDAMTTWAANRIRTRGRVERAIARSKIPGLWIDTAPLPCGCDPANDHYCPEHRPNNERT